MGFEDLEKWLRATLEKGSPSPNAKMRDRILKSSLDAFLEKQELITASFWKRFSVARFSAFSSFAFAAILVLFNVFPGGMFFLSAGEVLPIQGPVEILRGNDIILVQGATKLRKGDLIRVGNKAEAEIIFPDRFASTAKSRTEIKIVDKDSLFVEKGSLKSHSFEKEAEISTRRGFVRTAPDAMFHVTVSESGETKVISENNKISVFDWKDGQTVLHGGEELSLRTDTELSHQDVPTDLNLSFAQTQAIQAKLIIARTKALTGVEKILDGEIDKGGQDLASSQRSFLSIAQILESSRSLEITKRKTLSRIDLDDIISRLQEKTINPVIKDEAVAMRDLLLLIDQNRGEFGFQAAASPVPEFNRFFLVDRLFALEAKDDNLSADILKQKYVIAFLRDIQNEEVKMDQLTKLNEYIAALPKDGFAKEFLLLLEELFPPDLAEIIDQKIQEVF